MQDGVYDAFTEAVTEKVRKLKQGPGLDPSTTLGPLINDAAVERVSPETLTLQQWNILPADLFIWPQLSCACGSLQWSWDTMQRLHCYSHRIASRVVTCWNSSDVGTYFQYCKRGIHHQVLIPCV